MAISIRPMVSAPLAGCCTIFSIFGVVILVAFGSFYARHVEALAGSVNDAPDPDKVARACYGAAVLYAIFVGFCGLQNRRVAEGWIKLVSADVHRPVRRGVHTLMPQMVVHQRFPRGVQLS